MSGVPDRPAGKAVAAIDTIDASTLDPLVLAALSPNPLVVALRRARDEHRQGSPSGGSFSDGPFTDGPSSG